MKAFEIHANCQLPHRDVLSSLQAARPLFSSFLRIRSLAKSQSNPELNQARSELESTLTDVSADLQDLVDSVRAIEHDPYRYGLELEEVYRRRKLVDDVGAEIEQMRQEMQKPVKEEMSVADDAATSAAVATSGSGGRGTSKISSLPNPADFDNMDSPTEDRGNDYYSAMEQQRQVELMNDQDEQLDGVFRTVGNLRQQANDMGRELEDQSVMIGEVDTLADRVGSKLSNGVVKLKYIIRKNEGMYYLPAKLLYSDLQKRKRIRARKQRNQSN